MAAEKKCSKTFFKLLERQNLQNQYLNCKLVEISQNIAAILTKFSNLQKKIMKILHKAATTKFLSKIPNRKRISMKNLIFVRKKDLYTIS